MRRLASSLVLLFLAGVAHAAGFTPVETQFATHLNVSAPDRVWPGAPFDVTVAVLDASGKRADSYSGTIHFTSSTFAALPADYTFVPGESRHTFRMTFPANGTHSLTATDVATASIAGTANVVVSDAPELATHLELTAPATAGTGIPFDLTVTALDAANATVSGYTGTIEFNSTVRAQLPLKYTFVAADNGSHTFRVTLAGPGEHSVTADDTFTRDVYGTTRIDVIAVPQAATHYRFTIPGSMVSGLQYQVTLSALDAFETPVDGYTGTVHFTSSSPADVLPADYTFVAGDHGTHTFSLTLSNLGSRIFQAWDTATPFIFAFAKTYVGCSGFPDAAPYIDVLTPVCANSIENRAAPSFDSGTYEWSIINGTITAGQGTNLITFAAGESGNLTLTVRGTGPDPCTHQSARVTVQIGTLADADLGEDIRACAGTTVEIRATLIGNPPFTVHWSDGVIQSDIMSHRVTRSVVVAEVPRTYTIDRVTQFGCTNDDMHKRIRVIGTSLPVIDGQTRQIQIRRGETALLHVSTSTANVVFNWYEGTVGDTSKPIGVGEATLRTPVLHRNTQYWVRLTTACGIIDSDPMIVNVTSSRTRAVHP